VDKFKAIFMYILALVVLLAPAILLGWIGWSLLDWWGGILGVILGLALFAYSINKIIAQESAEDEDEETTSENSETNSLVK
jgi:FtsH-binding integral membrane protein